MIETRVEPPPGCVSTGFIMGYAISETASIELGSGAYGTELLVHKCTRTQAHSVKFVDLRSGIRD